MSALVADPHTLLVKWTNSSGQAKYTAPRGRGWCVSCNKFRDMPACPESEKPKEAS